MKTNIMKTIEIDGKLYLIDIEKATEQGLLKEKDSKPHSWIEYIGACNENTESCTNASNLDTDDRYRAWRFYDTFNSEDEAKAFHALGKLIQLRDAWVGDWEPDWKKVYNKYTIINARDRIDLNTAIFDSGALAFPTKEMANDFLETFRNLIEQAKMFL